MKTTASNELNEYFLRTSTDFERLIPISNIKYEQIRGQEYDILHNFPIRDFYYSKS